LTAGKSSRERSLFDHKKVRSLESKPMLNLGATMMRATKYA
jgi:hypothetical protein